MLQGLHDAFGFLFERWFSFSVTTGALSAAACLYVALQIMVDAGCASFQDVLLGACSLSAPAQQLLLSTDHESLRVRLSRPAPAPFACKLVGEVEVPGGSGRGRVGGWACQNGLEGHRESMLCVWHGWQSCESMLQMVHQTPLR